MTQVSCTLIGETLVSDWWFWTLRTVLKAGQWDIQPRVGLLGHVTVHLLPLMIRSIRSCSKSTCVHRQGAAEQLVKELKANSTHPLWVKYICKQKRFQSVFTHSSKPIIWRWKGQESYSSPFSLSLGDSAIKNARVKAQKESKQETVDAA